MRLRLIFFALAIATSARMTAAVGSDAPAPLGVAVAASSAGAFHSVLFTWNPVKAADGEQVYYNVQKDINGTNQYSLQNPSPLLCAGVVVAGVTKCGYFDTAGLTAGDRYNYQVQGWTIKGGAGPWSVKALTPVIP